MSLVELSGISRQYRMGQIQVNAVLDIDLTVESGDFVSIMGPSGSGKSTLLNIIGCLDRPSGGTYLLGGRRVDRLGDSQLADVRNRMLGFVFQTFHLLSNLTAQANVELPLIYRGIGRFGRRQAASEALAAVGLAERRHHRPSQLSGGEQQRVAIARALVGQPSIMLADEPSGALDSRSSLMIMDIFRRLNRERGLTIIQVTHDESIARHGQRIVRLLDGRIEREEVTDGAGDPAGITQEVLGQ